MGLDPVLVSNTREWLLLAREDLRTAELCLTAKPPLVRTALFHAQQCAEKVLKALLTWHDVPFRKTHNLEELGEACAKLEPAIGPFLDRLTTLNKYGVRFRYPGAPAEPALDEARGSLALAGEFFQAILDRLPGEVRTGI